MEKNRVDSEFLIATIKKFEYIWNKDLKDYQKKSCKEDAWNQVCEELYDHWNNYSEEEKTYKQCELKKRWNNIRDYYKKDLALQLNGTIGQPSMKRKKYVFSKQLDFLRPFFDKSCYTEKASEDDGEDGELYIKENYSSDSEPPTPKRKNPLNTLDKKKIVEVTVPVNADKTEDDCDLLFLKSLVPDMRMMNREQKIDFKMGILQLCKNIISENRECGEYDMNGESKNPLM